MGIEQLTYLDTTNFNPNPIIVSEDFKNKVQTAIDRLRHFEPPEGYYGCFSGGKDSQCIYELSKMAKVKVDWHYNVTGLDYPELVRFIRRYYPEVKFERREKSFWKALIYNGYPTRKIRWCCREYKEHSGDGRFKIIGIRWAESVQRKGRSMVEVCNKKNGGKFLSPIIDWTGEINKKGRKVGDVWDFIKARNLPYCSMYDEGWDRLGCILCPMKSYEKSMIDYERYPEFAKLWRKAFNSLYIARKESFNPEKDEECSVDKWVSGDEMFEWWLTRKGFEDEDSAQQCFMFE